jgi:hypothetical protein
VKSHVRRIAPFIYEKDTARKGLATGGGGGETDGRPAGDGRRRRKMIRANDTSHEYDRPVTDVCKLRLVSAREEIIFLGGISSSLVEVFTRSRGARKGRVPVACHYDISNECLQHCETTLRRCRYNTVVLYPFLIRD